MFGYKEKFLQELYFCSSIKIFLPKTVKQKALKND